MHLFLWKFKYDMHSLGLWYFLSTEDLEFLSYQKMPSPCQHVNYSNITSRQNITLKYKSLTSALDTYLRPKMCKTRTNLYIRACVQWQMDFTCSSPFFSALYKNILYSNQIFRRPCEALWKKHAMLCPSYLSQHSLICFHLVGKYTELRTQND